MRGESGRVAERVRALLGDHGEDAVAPVAPMPSGSPMPLGSPVPLGSSVSPSAGARPVPVGSRLIGRIVARIPVRVDPGRRAAVAIGLAVVVAAVITGWWVLAERPRALAVSASAPPIAGASAPAGSGDVPAPTSSPSAPATHQDGATAAGAAGGPGAASPSLVVVDVAGKVHRPGLYRLPAGSRIDDAVRAAGGQLGGVDLSSLNLAARVVDGQQIRVGIAGTPVGAIGPAGGGPSGGGAPGSDGAAPGPVNLNTATLDQLETLPGVGPVLGQHILDWRTAHGQFNSIDQLNDVPGIGEVKYGQLRPLVTV